MVNYYKILGVKDFSPIEEIKTAYRKLSKKFHPDLNEGDKFFEEKFKEIQDAYGHLTDFFEKKKHDDELSNYYRGSNSNSSYKYQEKESDNTTPAKPENDKNKKRDKQKSFTFAPFLLFAVTGLVILSIYLLSRKESNNQSLRTRNSYRDSTSVPSHYTSPATASNDISPTPPFIEAKQDYSEYEQISEYTSYFTIGSSKETVLRVQGSPTRISKIEVLNQEAWSFELSSVTFKNGKVNEYSNLSGNLKVRMEYRETAESNSYDKAYFTIGSSKDHVLRVQGNPTRISKIEVLNQETWSFELSSVTFKNGKVNEYSNLSGNLKVRMEYRETAESNLYNNAFFTIGSSKDEVLRVQGNPDRINKIEVLNQETWSYEFSSVTFKHGKVSEYSNLNNNLKVRL